MVRLTTILGLVIAAAAFLTAPIASAKWTDKGVAIGAGTNPQVQLTGQTAITSAVVGGIECQAALKAQMLGNQTTGTIDSAEVDLAEAGSTYTQKCKTSGPLAPCDITTFQPTQLPWTIHSSGADTITITTGQGHFKIEEKGGMGACDIVQQLTLEAGTATATIAAGQTSAIKEVHMSGQLTTSTGSKVTVHGTLNVAAPNNGTYGTA